MDKTHTELRGFFAAANGYSGFRSYFSQIFDPKRFEKIYVLKGGPGTGKSSLMKRLRAAMRDNGCDVESVLCSSDPKSLDGIIVSSDTGRVAVIDGTAPHERDAMIPGAKDEIVHLGSLWDSRYLYGSKDKICELSSAKSSAYQAAYSYLKTAGAADDAERNVVLSSFDKNSAKKRIKILADNALPIEYGNISHRLISAFCKDGYVQSGTFDDKKIATLRIGGERKYAMHFIGQILQYLIGVGAQCTLLHSPFADDDLEGLYFKESDTLITLTDSIECDVNADEFFSLSPDEGERIRVAGQLRGYALDEAARWFGIASDLHFRLEKIYTAAMCFEKIDGVYDRLLVEMTDVLK